VWDFTRTVAVFASLDREALAPELPSGEVARVADGWALVSLPTERRNRGEIGCRVNLLDDRITGSFSLFREQVANSAFRDWAWEAANPEAVATTGGGWFSPVRYGVCDRLTRAGWRTEWNFQPLRNLTAVFNWYEDLENHGPVTGGNHRGMFLARYDFDCGWLKGFSFGGGFDYRNTVRFNDGVELAGGLNWNLLFGYERKVTERWTTNVRLTLRNLGGNEYQPTRFANDRGRQLLLLLSQEF
jgi:hypothetical protein